MNAPLLRFNMLEPARSASRIGGVFPLAAGTKNKPLIANWPQLATQDERLVRAQWGPAGTPDANVAIHCAGLAVVDRDDRKGGAEAFAELDALLGFPETYTVRTPSGGAHYYYRLPGGHVGVPNTVEELGRGIDTRSTGGFVVAAGSRTDKGAYIVEKDLPIANAPQWLLDRLGQVKPKTTPKDVPDAPEASVERAREWLALQDPAIEEQGGDKHTYVVACGLRDQGVSEEQAFELMQEWNKRCEPEWTLEDLRVKVRNGYSYSQNEKGGTRGLTDDDLSLPQPLEPKPAAPSIIVKRSPLDWADLAQKAVPPREWAIDHWLGFFPTLCAGRGGIGKSLLAQQAASALSIGRSYIGDITKPYTVLMWACEDDHDELWRRQTDIATHFGVPLEAFKGRLIVEPRQGLTNTLLAPVYGALQFTPLMAELIAQVGDYKADVVIVDNTGQTFGANENERHPVTTYMNALAGLGQGRPVAAIALAHPARAKGSEYAGSAAWENAARMRWYLGDTLPDKEKDESAEPDPLVRYLAKRKQNYTVADWRRLTYTGGALAVEAPPTMQERVDRAEIASAAVLSGIRRLAAMGEHCTASTASPGYLPKLLIKYGLAEGCTAAELDHAMRLAMTTGKVKKAVVGHYSNRAEKHGLIVEV